MSLSTASVLTQIERLEPPGTPLTLAEIEAAVECSVDRLDTSLERLVSHRILNMKELGDHRRVWWRPASRQSVESSDSGEIGLGFDPSDETTRQSAATVDRAEQARTKQALRQSERRLRLALQAGDVGTWELDLRSEESLVRSPEHDRIFGYTEPRDDWSFEIFLDHVHPDDRTAVEQGFESAFETGHWEFDCRIHRADGVERWITSVGEFYMDSGGEPVRAVGVVRDITERMDRQWALEATKQQYQTLLANFPNGGVALLDDSLCHEIVDGLGFETVGIDVETLRGRRVEEAFPADIASTLQAEYRATLGGEGRRFELEIGERTCEFRTITLTDVDGGDAILSIFHDITYRMTQQERRLSRLAGVHDTVQAIAHVVIESSTRAEVEAMVYDRFDASESYTASWVGRLDRAGPTIRPTVAGASKAAVDCTGCQIPVEADAPTISGPIAAAIETDEAQLVKTSLTDPIYQQWSQSTPINHRPGVVVPIQYDDHVYGVFVIYTDRDGFEPRELDTLGRLGQIVGHTITSIDRKRALTSGQATEVVVRSDSLAEPFVAATDDESMTVSIDHVQTFDDGRSLSYYTVEGIAPEQFATLLETLVDGSEVRLLEQIGTRSRFEISTDAKTLHSIVASHGGWITSARLRDGDFEITIRVPIGTELRSVLDAARTRHPDLRLISQTTVIPSTQTAADTVASLITELTDRQREVLEVGYYAGFFEWPRDTTGDELAELMGVTPATVHHHLRYGQQKLLAAFFELIPQSVDSN